MELGDAVGCAETFVPVGRADAEGASVTGVTLGPVPAVPDGAPVAGAPATVGRVLLVGRLVPGVMVGLGGFITIILPCGFLVGRIVGLLTGFWTGFVTGFVGRGGGGIAPVRLIRAMIS
jgi:hypothetical protein